MQYLLLYTSNPSGMSCHVISCQLYSFCFLRRSSSLSILRSTIKSRWRSRLESFWYDNIHLRIASRGSLHAGKSFNPWIFEHSTMASTYSTHCAYANFFKFWRASFSSVGFNTQIGNLWLCFPTPSDISKWIIYLCGAVFQYYKNFWPMVMDTAAATNDNTLAVPQNRLNQLTLFICIMLRFKAFSWILWKISKV